MCDVTHGNGYALFVLIADGDGFHGEDERCEEEGCRAVFLVDTMQLF